MASKPDRVAPVPDLGDHVRRGRGPGTAEPDRRSGVRSHRCAARVQNRLL